MFPFQYWVEFVATTAFALSGITQAARRDFDVVGVFAVAGLAAFGGGTLHELHAFLPAMQQDRLYS